MDHTKHQVRHSVSQHEGEPDGPLDWKTIKQSESVCEVESVSTPTSKCESYESDGEVEHQSEKSKVAPWKTTMLQVGPIAGICALLISLLSLLFALAILLVSRGESANWNIPPSSCLAICTAVANQALRFAAFQGVAIAWWIKAMHGSTFARLHSDCEYEDNIEDHTLRSDQSKSFISH